MKYWMIAAAILFANVAAAHEMTPAYPKFEPIYLDGVLRTTLKIWNRREDASYYEINVYDEEWNKISFSTVDKIVRVGYLETKSFEIYIREEDLEKVEFICSTSKLLKKEVNFTGITSRICSRVK
mgnify:CR=1 FL=1